MADHQSIIPAAPGWFAAQVVEGDTPEDVGIFYEPIVAWFVTVNEVGLSRYAGDALPITANDGVHEGAIRRPDRSLFSPHVCPETEETLIAEARERIRLRERKP